MARQILSQFEEKFGLPQIFTTRHVTKTIRVRRTKPKRKQVAAKTAAKPKREADRRSDALQARRVLETLKIKEKTPRKGFASKATRHAPRQLQGRVWIRCRVLRAR